MNIEDLITDKNESVLEFNADYFNYDTGHSSINNFVSSLGYRYGVSADTEIYGSVSIAASDSQGIDREYSPPFPMAWDKFKIGVNHRFSPDNDTPAFLGFAEIVAAENVAHRENDFVYGKTVRIGFTVYRASDPVVLSLTSSYRYAAERTIPGGHFNPGEMLSLSPSLGFAINNKV